MKKINNYRWQQQQQAKLQHQKVKKIKKEAEKLPVSAAEELEYINKLLSGEEVEDFGPKEVESSVDWGTNLRGYWIPDPSKVSLIQYLDMISGKGYYR